MNTINAPVGEYVLVKARSSRQSKYFNTIKSEFDQTETVGTLISLGKDVPTDAECRDFIGKLIFFPAFQEVKATADPDSPEIFIHYKVIRGYEKEESDGK
jgi:hypothetical protein